MVAILALAQVGEEASHQPSASEAAFSQPYFYKGTWRYITDQQAAISSAATFALPLGVLFFVAGVVWVALIEYRAATRKS